MSISLNARQVIKLSAITIKNVPNQPINSSQNKLRMRFVTCLVQTLVVLRNAPKNDAMPFDSQKLA